MTRSVALVRLAVAAVLWSTGGVLIKLVDWDPLAIAGARSAIAALVLLAFFGRAGLVRSPAALWGACAYAAMVILFVVANRTTSSANAVLLQYTAPVYVALLSWRFLGERIQRQDLVMIVAVLVGMGLLVSDGLSWGGWWGDLLALLSGVAFAVMVVSLRHPANPDPVPVVVWGNIIATLFTLPWVFGSVPNASSLAVIGVLGVFQLGLAYVLYSRAVKQVSAFEAVLITTIEPVLNPIWAMVFMNEIPSRPAALGGALVIAAVTARSIRIARRG